MPLEFCVSHRANISKQIFQFPPKLVLDLKLNCEPQISVGYCQTFHRLSFPIAGYSKRSLTNMTLYRIRGYLFEFLIRFMGQIASAMDGWGIAGWWWWSPFSNKRHPSNPQIWRHQCVLSELATWSPNVFDGNSLELTLQTNTIVCVHIVHWRRQTGIWASLTWSRALLNRCVCNVNEGL